MRQAPACRFSLPFGSALPRRTTVLSRSLVAIITPIAARRHCVMRPIRVDCTRMPPDPISLLRGELTDIVSAAFFLFIGLLAFGIAAVRRRSGVRILVWIGIWSILFGSNMLAQSSAVRAALPAFLQPARVLCSVASSYLTLVAAALAYLELTLGYFRRFMWFLLVADLVVAIAGIGAFVLTGNAKAFIVYNQILAVAGLLILLATVSVPSLSRRFLVLAEHRVLTVGTLIFAVEALLVNAGRPFRIEVPSIYSSLGFAVLLLSFGYVALDRILENERRFLAVEKELEIARQLQFSILPAGPPEIGGLQIAAAYEPMTSVAGDFYEFLSIDAFRNGFLVADVSGHGVPAALVAAMLKVATQSMDGCAADPAEVLRRLGSTLAKNVQGQLVTAAYFCADTSSCTALYSAAGHPPLLRWNKNTGSLTRIESNGLILGVPSEAEAPVCTVPLTPGDRFLLYTDGITEPENATGEAFGDRRLEQVLHNSNALPASELLRTLLREVRAWQPASQPQQDDMTLIVIDVL